MESNGTQHRLVDKCSYVATCFECDYSECYDHLLLAQNAAQNHSGVKRHRATAAYAR